MWQVAVRHTAVKIFIFHLKIKMRPANLSEREIAVEFEIATLLSRHADIIEPLVILHEGTA